MRRYGWHGVLMLVCVGLCLSCAARPRYQLPQTAAQQQQAVTTIEQTYMEIYRAHTAQELSQQAMSRVDAIYAAWRTMNQQMIEAIRAGALAFKPD